MNKNILYNLIKKYYEELENKLNPINWEEILPDYVDELNSARLKVQCSTRRLLNSVISEYVAVGGKKDISKYCKYYV